MKRSKILALTLLFLGLLLVHDLLLLGLTSRDLRQKSSQDALNFSRMSAKPVVEAYQQYYASGFYKFKELTGNIMRMNPDLQRIILLDVAGAVLFDSRELTGPKPAAGADSAMTPELLAAVKGLETSCRVVKVRDGQLCLDVVVPYIEEWGRHEYSVRLQILYRPLQQTWLRMWLKMLLAATVTTILGVLAVSRLLIGCLNRIANGTQRADG